MHFFSRFFLLKDVYSRCFCLLHAQTKWDISRRAVEKRRVVLNLSAFSAALREKKIVTYFLV